MNYTQQTAHPRSVGELEARDGGELTPEEREAWNKRRKLKKQVVYRYIGIRWSAKAVCKCYAIKRRVLVEWCEKNNTLNLDGFFDEVMRERYKLVEKPIKVDGRTYKKSVKFKGANQKKIAVYCVEDGVRTDFDTMKECYEHLGISKGQLECAIRNKRRHKGVVIAKKEN